MVTGPTHNSAQAQDTTRPNAPLHQSEMDQRIEVALKKDIPNRIEEAAVVRTFVEDDEEQLNSDDDISDYNDVLDTGDNILLGYYVKVQARNPRARERKTRGKSNLSTAS
jgi:hypothetical protein